MGRYVVGFREIDRTQGAVVGGKGAHLGELSRVDGIRVPAGFCVTTDAFRPIVAYAPSLEDRLERLSRTRTGERGASRALSAGIRRTLEGITHPRIAVAGKLAMAAHQDTDAPFLLYEAPLLVEIGLYKAFPALVVVSLEPARQLERLMAREQCSESDALARIDSQLPLAEKVKVADFVIDNGGTLEETERQVRTIYDELSRRAAESSR